MTISELKKIYQILKKAYAELESEAIKEGVDLMSSEYDQMKDALRNQVLKKAGFTLADYQSADKLYRESRNTDALSQVMNDGTVKMLSETQARMQAAEEKVQTVENKVQTLKIPTVAEITAIAKTVANTYIKPPQIINQIVRETTIREPRIIKETTIEKTVEEKNYNAKPLQDQIDSLKEQFKNVPTQPDVEKLKEEMRGEFDVSLKKSINVMNMPDFRKLAMGLRQDIDYLLSITPNAGNAEVPGGTVNGSNTTFTVNHQPKYVIIDNMYKMPGFGYTYSDGVITVDSDAPPAVFIRSIY